MTQSPTLIVGLGNPGAQYAATRHNAGVVVVDALAAQYGASFGAQSQCHAHTARVRTPTHNLILAKPTTFMNDSGRSVRALCDYYDIPAARVILVHDESDLPLGTYRIQTGRGAAGHNGVASVIAALGTKDFTRVRVGVRPERPEDAPRAAAMAFVLKEFAPAERALFADVVKDVTAAIDAMVTATVRET